MTDAPLKKVRSRILVRQLFFAVLTCSTLVIIACESFRMLRTNGLNGLKISIFILFLLLLAPITLSFWTAIIGFLGRLGGSDPLDLAGVLAEPPPPLEKWPLTAVIVPVYNEDPARVFAGLKATYESLQKSGYLGCFEFFVLSDTTNPDTWVREEMAFVDFRKSVSEPGRIFYRNRRENLERKTGNIAEFCASWGGRYRYMIVFDADSIMTGKCLVDLVRLMEHHPHAGIIQAPPMPINRNTFFGRLRQFATHAYTTNFITGLNFWQGGAANYWGHNAIIRIEPFIEHCHLPTLSGPEPLGGSILSHDFVEAAFMRRAGWRVYLATQLRGSYEELPPSLITYAARDRRWCQGNLQHTRLLTLPGLHPVSRLHMCLGVMGYVSAPLWMLMLVLSTIEGVREAVSPHPYFPARALHPVWRISVEHQAIWLFVGVMCLLLAPSILSLITNLIKPAERAAFGGAGKLTLSVLMETLSSTLLAPVMAILQSHFVIGILMGRNIKWEAQDRGEASTTYGEAILRHWPATLLGILWSILLISTAPKLFWWFSPIILGFVLSIPVSVWTSTVSLGQWARRHGIFLTPEETDPPAILQTLDHELELAATRPWANPGDALRRVLNDPDTREMHLSMLGRDEGKDEIRRHYLEGLELKYRHQGPAALTLREKRDLLLDEEAIRSLLAPQRELTPAAIAAN